MATLLLRWPMLNPVLLRSTVFHRYTKFLHPEKKWLHLSIKDWSQYKVSDKSEEKLKIMDDVSDEFELIYKAPMEILLKTAYPVIGLCVILPTVKLIHQYYNEGRISLAPVEEFVPSMHLINPYLEISVFSGALALFAIASYGIIFKYAFRIYKHKKRNEYIALYLSYIPFTLKKFYFKSAAHVQFKNPFYNFMMEGCHFRLDGKNTFLITVFFRTPSDMLKMIGEW